MGVQSRPQFSQTARHNSALASFAHSSIVEASRAYHVLAEFVADPTTSDDVDADGRLELALSTLEKLKDSLVVVREVESTGNLDVDTKAVLREVEAASHRFLLSGSLDPNSSASSFQNGSSNATAGTASSGNTSVHESTE